MNTIPLNLNKYTNKELDNPPNDEWNETEEFIRKNKRPFIHKKESAKFERRILKTLSPNNKRSTCIRCRRALKTWDSKRVWRRENFFNNKAGGKYTKITKLIARRKTQQEMYAEDRASQQYTVQAYLKHQQRRQLITC